MWLLIEITLPSLQRAEVPLLPSVGMDDFAAATLFGVVADAGAAGLGATGAIAAVLVLDFMQLDMKSLYFVAFLSASDFVFQVAAQEDIVLLEDLLAMFGAADAGAIMAVVDAPDDLDRQDDMKSLRVVFFLSASLMVFQLAEQDFILSCAAVCAALFANTGVVNKTSAAVATIKRFMEIALSIAKTLRLRLCPMPLFITQRTAKAWRIETVTGNSQSSRAKLFSGYASDESAGSIVSWACAHTLSFQTVVSG